MEYPVLVPLSRPHIPVQKAKSSSEQPQPTPPVASVVLYFNHLLSLIGRTLSYQIKYLLAIIFLTIIYLIYSIMSSCFSKKKLSSMITKTKSKKGRHHHVRFAEAPQVISLHGRQTTFSPAQKDLLWYSQEDFDQFRLDTTLYSDAIKIMFQYQKLLFGHHGDFGNILGLEKYLLSNSYFDRRTRLKTVVFEEQVRQRLHQEEMKTGLMMDEQLCGSFANYRLLSATRLAKIADKESRWARERAQIIGLVLQSHLSMTESITAGE